MIDNNSNDGTKELFIDNKYNNIDGIYYYSLDENIGGAGGFSKGVEIAYKLGYDLMWLMDDDGRPYNINTLNEIIKISSKIDDNKLFIINSLVLCNESQLSFGLGNIKFKSQAISESKNGVLEGMINPFNGTMISKELVKLIGYPEKSFFIKGDETEYLLRAKKSGAYIATCVNSLYYHPRIQENYKVIFGKKIISTNESAWKEYYRSRNYIYINKKYNGIYNTIIFILKRFISMFFYTDNKLLKIKMSLKGLRDGILNKMGKSVTP